MIAAIKFGDVLILTLLVGLYKIGPDEKTSSLENGSGYRKVDGNDTVGFYRHKTRSQVVWVKVFFKSGGGDRNFAMVHPLGFEPLNCRAGGMEHRTYRSITEIGIPGYPYIIQILTGFSTINLSFWGICNRSMSGSPLRPHVRPPASDCNISGSGGAPFSRID